MKEKKTLLFVDDEPNILSALKRVFFDDDFEILTATSGKEALKMMEGQPVQLVISDQRMPEMSGTELLAKIREKNPEIMRVILTGFADMDAAVEAINSGQIYQFIFKPWNDEELRSVVVRALEHFDLEGENKRLLSQLKAMNDQLSQKVKERTQLIVQKNVELGKLNKTLESSLVNTVRVFVNLLEMSRPEVSRHARRVATVATALAKELDWDEKHIRDLEIASLLHDIGKIGIPESILRKAQDDLVEGEQKILKNHPLLGQNTLGAIDSFQNVGKIVRAHHERWDGGGFPDGLKGDQIPVEARLLSLCNVFDHLEQDERSPAFIAKFVSNNAGSVFDPSMVNALMNYLGVDEDTAAAAASAAPAKGGAGGAKAGGKTEAGGQRKMKVKPGDLKPGMILVDTLMTGKGIFLLPEGQLLKETHIRSIQDIQRVDPIKGSIEVLVE